MIFDYVGVTWGTSRTDSYFQVVMFSPCFTGAMPGAVHPDVVFLFCGHFCFVANTIKKHKIRVVIPGAWGKGP